MSTEHYLDREQSAVKHRILKRYLEAFAPIIGQSSYQEIVYVDCLAGPWHSEDSELRDTSFHTAISVFKDCLALRKCHRVRVLLIEKRRRSYRRLKEYADRIEGIEIVSENWDFTQHVPEIVAFCKKSPNSFPFVFLDPTGYSQIGIDQILPLLRLQPGEVLINFMSKFVKRFLKVQGPDRHQSFVKLLGREGVSRLQNLYGDELEDELLNVYAQRVREAGHYKYTCEIPVLNNARDEIIFHMVYGTRHFRGLEVFKETEADAIPFMHELRADGQRRRDIERTGNLFLLSAEETYRVEQRFREYRARRLCNAKADALEFLKRNGPTEYKSLYEHTMQYSTVLQDDLRDWLSEWRAAGIVAYDLRPRHRVPEKLTLITLTQR